MNMILSTGRPHNRLTLKGSESFQSSQSDNSVSLELRGHRLAVEVEIHVWIHSHVIVKSTRSKGQIFQIFLFFISLSLYPVYEWSPYLVLCFAGVKLSPVVFYGLCLLRTNKRKRNENGIPQPLFSLSLTERPFHLYILFPSPYQKKLERKREKGEKEGQNFHLLY